MNLYHFPLFEQDQEHSQAQAQQSALPEAPTVLRCSNTADFLAALPRLTGLTYEPGLFVVLFRGRRAQHTLRFDLPESTDPHTVRKFITSLCSVLTHTGDTLRRPALVLVTDEPFAQAPHEASQTGSDCCASQSLNSELPRSHTHARAPLSGLESTPVLEQEVLHSLSSGFKPAQWRVFSDAVLHRFRREGWKLREFAVITSTGWATLHGENAGTQQSLGDISESRLATSGDLPSFTPQSLKELGTLPSVEFSRAQEISQHLSDLPPLGDASLQHPNKVDVSCDTPSWIYGAARIAGQCFSTALTSPPTDPRLLARLARLCETSNGWLVCALTALTRPQFVIDMFETGAAQHLLDSPLSQNSRVSPPMSLPQSAQAPGRHLVGFLRALATEQPCPRKLEQATVTLRDLAAHLPKKYRAGVLALLAWAWWHTGMQSLAHNYIVQAQTYAPGNDIVQMVSLLNEAPPQWRLQSLSQAG